MLKRDKKQPKRTRPEKLKPARAGSPWHGHYLLRSLVREGLAWCTTCGQWVGMQHEVTA